MPVGEFRVVSSTRHEVGECPTWDDHSDILLWTSIIDGRIHWLDPQTGKTAFWQFEAPVGSFGLCRSGRLIVALKSDIVLFDRQAGAQQTLASIDHPIAAMRLNDGKVGADGAFYVGSMDDRPAKEPIGTLYRVMPNGKVDVVADGLHIANGLAWDAAGTTMYFSDSRGPWVDACDFDPATGTTSNRRRFATLSTEAGRPDGAACDAEGCYWSAGPSASVLNRFSPDGALLSSIKMPSFRPTMPCFGGPDLRTVYVTSLTQNLTSDQIAQNELAGTVIAFAADVAGLPTNRFAD